MPAPMTIASTEWVSIGPWLRPPGRAARPGAALPVRGAVRRGRAALAVVLHLDLGAADGVVDGFGALVGGLAQHHLLAHPRLLVDHRLLGGFGRLDDAVLETGGVGPAERAVHRVAFQPDVFLLQGHLILHRRLDHVAADADAAMADVALADAQALLGQWDRRLRVARRRAASRARARYAA